MQKKKLQQVFDRQHRLFIYCAVADRIPGI